QTGRKLSQRTSCVRLRGVGRHRAAERVPGGFGCLVWKPEREVLAVAALVIEFTGDGRSGGETQTNRRDRCRREDEPSPPLLAQPREQDDGRDQDGDRDRL